MKLEELQQALKCINNPKQLSFSWGRVNDYILFIETHIHFLNSNPKNRRFLPYYNRLLEFYHFNK